MPPTPQKKNKGKGRRQQQQQQQPPHVFPSRHRTTDRHNGVPVAAIDDHNKGCAVPRRLHTAIRAPIPHPRDLLWREAHTVLSRRRRHGLHSQVATRTAPFLHCWLWAGCHHLYLGEPRRSGGSGGLESRPLSELRVSFCKTNTTPSYLNSLPVH